MDNLAELTDRSTAIRRALATARITGAAGAEIDHIELFGSSATGADSKNFVLCPGLAYDRSPCGTGTSAKLACLAADGVIAPGEEWVQESVTGSRFQATYELGDEGRILPTITGSAFVTAESQLMLDDEDPLRHGIS
jgi:4-hydroxyproline epimerase